MSESPNRTPQIDPVRQEIINKFPELRKFQNESPRRFEARATMLAELVAIKKNPSSKLGYIDNTDKTMQIIDRVIQNLKSNPTPSAIGDTIVLSTLGGKLGVLPVHQTTRVFLGRLLNDAKLLNDFFSESKERVPHDAEIEKQISRLGRVLVAFEQHHPDKEYKTVLRQTYALLDAGNLDGAKEKIRSTLQEYNIDVSSIVGDSQGCMNALRALGAMSDASQMGVSEMKGKLEGIDITPQQTKFKKFLEKNFQSTMPTSTVQAKAQIDVAMNALPDRSPQKIRLFQAGNGAIQTMAEEIAYMKCFDAFIAQNGSEGLGTMADVYNDMRGLKGVLNFTDENAKMTKEVAIMVASFAVTAGVGPLLGALGVGARLAQSSNMARVAKLTQEGKRLRAGMATAKATAWRGTAATLEVGAKATNLATGTKIMPAGGRIRATAEVAHNALKFTTADALIRHFARAEGEKDGFDNFLSKLVTNTVMFGAFGGMEKLVTVKMLPKGIAEAQGFTFKNAGKLLAFTGGDVAVMQAMHMAETGNIAWDWHSVYQALAFRVGMKGMEAHFPKLTKKWEDRTYKAGEIRIGMNVPKNLKATMTPDKYATMVKRNANLDPATRSTEVAELINVGKLTPEQYTALTKAHDTGKSGHGKWTQNELLDKYTILVKEGKFSQPQARQILEYGYTGKEPQQFMGDVNGFIISKRNGVNISTFQKDGYDLTDIGFEGWNVKQSQKKGNSTYTLTHPTEGTHMFKTPKEVQDFLRDGHIPKQTISEPLNKEGISVEVVEVKGSDLQQEYHQSALGTLFEIRDNNGDYFTGKIIETSPIELRNKLRYSGDVKKGQMYGEGKMIWTDGTIHEGRFAENGIWGPGKRVFPDGTIHDGLFLNNQLSSGTKTSKDGRIVNVKDGKDIILEDNLSGKKPVRVEGSGNIEKKIQEEARAMTEKTEGNDGMLRLGYNPEAKTIGVDRPESPSDRYFVPGRGEFGWSERQQAWVGRGREKLHTENVPVPGDKDFVGPTRIIILPDTNPSSLRTWLTEHPKLTYGSVVAVALAGGAYAYYKLSQDSEKTPVLVSASEPDIAHAMSFGTTTPESSTPAVVPETQVSTAKKEVTKHQSSYNEKMLESFKNRINTVLAKLIASTDSVQQNIGKLLQSALTNKLSRASVRALQIAMLAAGATAIGSKDGKPDGKFGPATMASLEGMITEKPTPGSVEPVTTGADSSQPDATVISPTPVSVVSQPGVAVDTRTPREIAQDRVSEQQRLIDAMKLLTYYVDNGKLPVAIPPRTETQEKEVIIQSINILNSHQNSQVTLLNMDFSTGLKNSAINAMNLYNLHTLEQEKQELLKGLVTTADVPDDRKHHTIDQILKMPNHGTQTREELIKMDQKLLDNLYRDLVFAGAR